MKSSLLDRITIEPGKCGGRSCVRGMRIRVTDVLGLLGAGASHQEILEDYPTLEEEDILAALEYAATETDHLSQRIEAGFANLSETEGLAEIEAAIALERKM